MNWPVFLTLIRLFRIMCRAFSGGFMLLASGVPYTGKRQPTACRILINVVNGMIVQFVRCQGVTIDSL